MKTQTTSEILKEWWQGMKADTQKLIKGRNKPPMYKSTTPNQEERWKANAK